MATVFNPTCSPAMSLRLSPLRSTISRPILRLSSSPNFTLNCYSFPKPYSHSRDRVRPDCSGGGVSGSTGDDGHRQNDMTNSCPDRACGGMSPPSCSYASAENSPKSHLFRLWKYHYHSLVAMKSLPKYVLVVMGLKALCGSTYAASLIIAIGKCVGIVSTLGDFPKVIHKVPFLADLKPSGKNVMEHVHKETIRPVGDPSGAVPDIQRCRMNHLFILAGLLWTFITYQVVVGVLRRGRSCLEVGGGVLRRGMTFLEAVGGVLRRAVTCLEVVGGVLRRCLFYLLVVPDIQMRFRRCIGIVSTLGDFPKVTHKVPFPADLKPSGKNVMEHVHKETIRPVGYPSGAVPDIQITYPVVAVALLKRGRSCLEVGGGVLRRGMTFLEVVVALLRRGVTCLEAVVGILRRGMTSLEAVVGILRRAMTCLEAVVGILRRAMTFLE